MKPTTDDLVVLTAALAGPHYARAAELTAKRQDLLKEMLAEPEVVPR